MKEHLLNFVVCPACKGSLNLDGNKPFQKDGEKIYSGRLFCKACTRFYEIREEIPRFIPLPGDSSPASKDTDMRLRRKTRDRFSFAWRAFGKREMQEDWNKDSYSYLDEIPFDFLNNGNKIVLDLGCGTGSDITRFAKRNVEVIGLDLADSIEIAYEKNKSYRNVHIIQGDIYSLPFRDNSFDLIYSLGVLHHLPDLKSGFKNMVNLAKKEGMVLVYLYEDFSDGGMHVKLLLKFVSLMRFFTVHMNTKVLYLSCILFAPFVWLFFSLPAFILKKAGLTGISSKLPFRHTLNLNCIMADLYDRFAPPIENRYSKEEVKSLFEEFGLKDMHIFKYRGWVAWGRK